MAHRKSRRASRRATRRANRASRKAHRKSRRNTRRNNMMGGGVFRYAATPVRKLGEGAGNVFENLLTSTGKVAHNVVYGASKAVGRAANALNNTGKSLLRNPLRARTRRHRSRRA